MNFGADADGASLSSCSIYPTVLFNVSCNDVRFFLSNCVHFVAGQFFTQLTSVFIVNGGWGTWGKWQACSKKCGTGTQHRSRFCNRPSPAHGGKHCSGQSRQTRKCNIQHCPGRLQL